MRILRCLLPFAMAVASVGCFTADPELTLNKDGSGIFEIRYKTSQQAIGQLKAMVQLRDQMDLASGAQPAATEQDMIWWLIDPTEEAIRKEISAYGNFGLVADMVKVENRNDGKSVHIKVHWNNLAKLAQADFFRLHGFSLTRAQDGNYLFYRPAISANPQEPLPAEMDAGGMSLVAPIFSGFRVTTTVHAPGRILESNASRKSGVNAVWVHDYNSNPHAVRDVQNQPMRIVFDGRGITLPTVSFAPVRPAASPTPPAAGK